MYKLVIIQKIKKRRQFLIMYTATLDEWENDFWKEWCEETGCTMEIAKEEFDYLPDHEYLFHFCILKTFWLNIFKRIWRKKHALIVERRKIHNLWNRNIHGKWLIRSPPSRSFC